MSDWTTYPTTDIIVSKFMFCILYEFLTLPCTKANILYNLSVTRMGKNGYRHNIAHEKKIVFSR